MRASLNRIEREYVLETLSDTLPLLELSGGASVGPFSVQGYSVSLGQATPDAPDAGQTAGMPSGARIDCRLRDGPFRDGQRVVVRFSHRKRKMRFESMARINRDGFLELPVPDEIFPDNEDSGSVDGISFEHDGALAEAVALESMPLESPSGADPAGGSGRLDAIAGKASIPGSNRAAAGRLIDYIEGFRRKRLPPIAPGERGHVIFIDNVCLLIAMGRAGWNIGGKFRLSVRLGRRVMRFDSRIEGIMPLSAESDILTLSCEDAQEEDKRFLYERLYGGIYTGEGGLPIDAGAR